MDRKIVFIIIIYLSIFKSAIAGGFPYIFPLGFGFGATTITDSDTTLSYDVIDCGGSGVGVTVNGSLTGIKLYNLTIANCDTAISLGSDAEVKNVLFENNTTDIGGAGTPTTATNYASADGDPLLIDPVNNNFGLQGNSPAKDAGTVLYTYAAHPGDFLGAKVYGAAPDIGAIEYKDHTFGGWFFEFFIPTIFNLCASTNANCYIQP